ncbi:Fe-S oxidoreductase [Candidatus Woesearchaeota archaeon]|nr:Fe-S oxidoreductase [Candidatus Woesearchaeota archaeon]
MKNILLVEPDFPVSKKSKNHSNFLPIGLLKLASYHRKQGNKAKLIRGLKKAHFTPDRILITSLFTYWSDYVRDAVQFYKQAYPSAKVEVGGIYASLMPKHCKYFTGCDKVVVGQLKMADKCKPAYDLVNVDYQIIHGMRGCIRQCSFCGIWRLEKNSFKTAEEIKKEICFNKLVFYDNNMLVNPHIEEILEMLATTTYNGKVLNCECQSGFDGRILAEKPHLAELLKKARFKDIRLAWDWGVKTYPVVEKWLTILDNAGFSRKSVFLFMIYNWDFKFEEMEEKRKKCYEWGVQIADCRFRPLNQLFDRYNGRIKQTNIDYFIHKYWTDYQVKRFRKNVRLQNICIRYNIPIENYRKELEGTRSSSKKLVEFGSMVS